MSFQFWFAIFWFKEIGVNADHKVLVQLFNYFVFPDGTLVHGCWQGVKEII